LLASTKPQVVLISLMAQPRLFAAMASDGLLPKIFDQRNAQGNLFYSNVLCGIPMTIVAMLVPFSYLDDCISVGILVAFNMTNTSLILMKCNDFGSLTTSTGQHQSFRLSRHLIAFHLVAFGSALAPRMLGGDSSEGTTASTTADWWTTMAGSLLLPPVCAVYIHSRSSKQPHFGSHLTTTRSPLGTSADGDSFETPMVPLVPLMGIAVNSFLIAQLESSGLFLLFLYLTIVSALYAMYCSKKNVSWGGQHQHHYNQLGTADRDDNGAAAILMDVLDHRDPLSDPDGPILLREFSMPKR
jgi:APA family basic amino acid/polyamine antiporter